MADVSTEGLFTICHLLAVCTRLLTFNTGVMLTKDNFNRDCLVGLVQGMSETGLGILRNFTCTGETKCQAFKIRGILYLENILAESFLTVIHPITHPKEKGGYCFVLFCFFQVIQIDLHQCSWWIEL